MVDKNKGRLFSSLSRGKNDSRSQSSLEGARRVHLDRDSHEDGLQLKIQLLLSRLSKHPPSRPPCTKYSPLLSKSKTSKLTFAKPQPLPLTEQLREVKTRTQSHFQFQFEILKEEYVALNHAYEQFLGEKEERRADVRQGMNAICGMLERVRDMALSLTLSRKHLKAYSLILHGHPNKKPSPPPSPETPFRLSLTPFQRDNSLLISVKRSLQGFASYSTAKKQERDSHNPDESYKYSQNINPPEQLPQNKQQESSYKDFIKETEEEEVAQEGSFEVLERSLMQKFHQGSGNCHKRMENSQLKVSSLAGEVNQLSAQILEERRNSNHQWRGIQAALKKQLTDLSDAINEERKRVLALQSEREAVFLLMAESVDQALSQQRRAYKQDHSSIIENLHQVISIFQ